MGVEILEAHHLFRQGVECFCTQPATSGGPAGDICGRGGGRLLLVRDLITGVAVGGAPGRSRLQRFSGQQRCAIGVNSGLVGVGVVGDEGIPVEAEQVETVFFVLRDCG